ncbi:hypothetical protein SPSIL_054000 [Sporomusa silvacetica DSM 10669]|uniref:Uncharacterized protein n=1 Tax=Sporomusa silvacetica DSM 10669 TaxID=1123289 RepID=A0ABZ3IU76_9FIRM|nr:hypothetical protein [Sporomusa silvacetica]OZC23787.1 hypothetical protein SPSIL_01070 [Sporomusa silvacetica DSM 10669]
MSTATTTVLGPINTQEQAETKKYDADNTTVATKKFISRDITREKWFWEIAVPS